MVACAGAQKHCWRGPAESQGGEEATEVPPPPWDCWPEGHMAGTSSLGMPGREKGHGSSAGWSLQSRAELRPFGGQGVLQAGASRGPSPQENAHTHVHNLGDNFWRFPGPLESMNSLEVPG